MTQPYREPADIAEDIPPAPKQREPLTSNERWALIIVAGGVLLNIGAALIVWPITRQFVGVAIIANVLIGAFIAACPAWRY